MWLWIDLIMNTGGRDGDGSKILPAIRLANDMSERLLCSQCCLLLRRKWIAFVRISVGRS